MNARATHIRHYLPPSAAAYSERRMPVSQKARPNGIITSWSYEPHRDLVTEVRNGGISAYGYVNDAIGRRASMSRSGSAYPASDVISYSYNDRSELTGAHSDADAAYSYSYAYDPIGNRTSASEAGVPWTYAANNLNQYTSATGNNSNLAFAYDLDGSMTYRPVDATSGWTQVWNCENRMAETYKGADRLTFRYDYMGRRVEKCVYSGNTLTSKSLFVYDGFKCVQELDGMDGNAVLRTHFWQPLECGLDVVLATADANGTVCFLHDANKNVMQETDEEGLSVKECQYALFGMQNNINKFLIGFSSESYDNQTNLSYYNYRYYSSLYGKWLSRDFKGEIEEINMYRFVDNTPVNRWDNLGLEGSDWGAVFPGTPGEYLQRTWKVEEIISPEVNQTLSVEHTVCFISTEMQYNLTNGCVYLVIYLSTTFSGVSTGYSASFINFPLEISFSLSNHFSTQLGPTLGFSTGTGIGLSTFIPINMRYEIFREPLPNTKDKNGCPCK